MAITAPEASAVADYVIALPRNVAARTIDGLAAIAHDRTRQGAILHTRTGRLFGSIYNRVAGTLARQVGHDTDKAPYAVHVLHGSVPHIIRPKNAKALRFINKAGAVVFAKFVRHPGYVGDDYLGRAGDDAIRGLGAIVSAALKET